MCAAVVYESRGHDDDAPAALPTLVVREAVGRLGSLWSELHDLETRHGLDITRRPDAGIVDATYRWAGGREPAAGADPRRHHRRRLRRWMRQVIDLLGQIAQAVDPGDPLRDAAHAAADLVNRGVVAYSSSV